jgi:hypothetical protein
VVPAHRVPTTVAPNEVTFMFAGTATLMTILMTWCLKSDVMWCGNCNHFGDFYIT